MIFSSFFSHFRDRVFKLNLKNVTLTGCEVSHSTTRFNDILATRFTVNIVSKAKLTMKYDLRFQTNNNASHLRVNRYYYFFFVVSFLHSLWKHRLQHDDKLQKRKECYKVNRKYGISLISCNTCRYFPSILPFFSPSLRYSHQTLNSII